MLDATSVVPIAFFGPFKTRAEEWMADYLIENPKASPSDAYRAYTAAFSRRGGRRMTPRAFTQKLEQLAA